MAEQYLRTLTASVNGKSVTYANTTDLRIRFDTHQAVKGTPHHCNIVFTNLAPATIAAMRKENAKVTLKAGYQSGAAGLIFEGEVLQVRSGRENVSDTYCHVLATSGGNGRNYATVNKALAAGHTHRDRIGVALDAMKPFGIVPGFIDELGKRKFPRNFVAHGMAHDLLREVCEAAGATWHIQGNRLNILKAGTTLPGGMIVINAKTGMVGLPEQTIEGVIVRCLLNPNLYPGGKVQLNNASIQQAALSPSTGAQGTNTLFGEGGILALSADGTYKIWRVEHEGDTRGQAYYTTITCTAKERPLALGDLMLPSDVDQAGLGGGAQ